MKNFLGKDGQRQQCSSLISNTDFKHCFPNTNNKAK